METSFETLFGRTAEVRAAAPGRVNLIGEHTDYNDGFVLPTPIPQETVIELARRKDDRVRAWSRECGADDNGIHEYRLGEERQEHAWIDFLAGVTSILRAEKYQLRGFEARITSKVPVGAGLSSSAALEISVLRALRQAFELELSDLELAVLGRRVENEFVGAPVGIMDQMASSLGAQGSALFIDTRSLEYKKIALPGDVDLVVIDSAVTHEHGTGEYRTRRAECERAAQLLGVAKLRDCSPADLPRVAGLPQPLDRRARHVITENDRVLRAVKALEAKDAAALGALFYASHASMRDDFEVSTPEIDLLVALAHGESAVYGARLTGGGFGGSIVALAARGKGAQVAEKVASAYRARSGRSPRVLVPEISAST